MATAMMTVNHIIRLTMGYTRYPDQAWVEVERVRIVLVMRYFVTSAK